MAISFEIYRDGRRLEAFAPAHAVPVGPESTPVPGQVKFADGRLTVSPEDDDPQPLGVALEWDMGPAGCYTLETTRLPQRDEPYVLNVELLRHRLMRLLQKQEDWVLFDLHRAGKDWARTMDRLKNALAEALAKLPTPADAAAVADDALDDAVELSEELARLHADLLLARRKTLGSLPHNLIGCGMDPGVRNARYRDTLAERFDFAHLPLTWRSACRADEEPDWSAADEAVAAARDRRLPIIAGPLIDFSRGELPDWLAVYEDDPDQVLEQAADFVRRATTRYKDKVGAWEVVGGLNLPSRVPTDFERLIEATQTVVGTAKRIVGAGAKVLVQVREPFGHYLGAGRGGVPALLYAELVSQSGVQCDGFSLSMLAGAGAAGGEVRDLFQISAMFDKFASLGKPLYVTSLGCPGEDDGGNGRFRRAWDVDVQAQWLARVWRVVLSKPYVECVAWPELGDEAAALPDGGLLDDMLRPKMGLEAVGRLREELRPGRAER